MSPAPRALPIAGALLMIAAQAFAHTCSPVMSAGPVTGSPGLRRIRTADRTIIAHTPPTARATAIDFHVRALASTFDSDGNVGTIVDTLIVWPGATVRFQWITGFHTLTEGLNSGDVDHARFNYIMDPTHTVFDTTLTTPGATMNYFCQVHEFPDRNQSMAGTIIVRTPSGVGDGAPTRVAFATPPSPNPSRSSIAFSIALPAERAVDLAVYDVSGRVVATIAHAPLGAGIHPFEWNGRASTGARAAAGRYILRLRAGAVSEVRSFTLLR